MGRLALIAAATIAAARALAASAGVTPGDGDGVGVGAGATELLLLLAVALAAAKLVGGLAARAGQPAVLGELVAGVLVGPSVLGRLAGFSVDPDLGALHLLAQLGVVLLLFEIGLETDAGQLLRAGPSAALVAVIGVAVPFVLGWSAVHVMARAGMLLVPEPLVGLLAIFLGATLTATSVGITARVLQDLDQMATPEARILIGAAVLDDVIGLVILAVVAAIGAAASAGTPLESAVGPGLVAGKLAIAVAFLAVAIAGGRVLAPKVLGVASRVRGRGVVAVLAVAFALALAAAAEAAGSALIIGGFAAGLALSSAGDKGPIEAGVKPVVDVLSPVFFVLVGAAVDVRHLDVTEASNRPVLALVLVLFVVAVAGKLASGLGVVQRGVRRLVVGVGMIPRGEVGLIFAQAGYLVIVPVAGVPHRLLPPPLYAAVTLTVMLTTFVAPPILRALVARQDPPERIA